MLHFDRTSGVRKGREEGFLYAILKRKRNATSLIPIYFVLNIHSGIQIRGTFYKFVRGDKITRTLPVRLKSQYTELFPFKLVAFLTNTITHKRQYI